MEELAVILGLVMIEMLTTPIFQLALIVVVAVVVEVCLWN